MADNITILDGAGASKVMAAEDVASVFYPRHNVQGYIAHDSAIAGNPVRLGARALTAAYTAVATGDTADLISTLTGALITRPWSIPELAWSYAHPLAASSTRPWPPPSRRLRLRASRTIS